MYSMKNLSVCLLILIIGVAQSKVILFTRHGQRAPTKFLDEQTKLKWQPLQQGDLTEVGVNYLIEKGQHLARQFDIFNGTGNCNMSAMEIISSIKQRTIMSTYAYIKGFCPKNFREISTKFTDTYLRKYSTNASDLEYLLNNNYENIFSLSNYTRTFEMENDMMFHGHDGSHCPIVDIVQEEYLESKQYHQWEESIRSRPQFAEIVEMIRVKDKSTDFEKYSSKNYPVKKMKSLLGDYKCEWAQQLDVPLYSEQQYQLLTEVATVIFYDAKNGHPKQKLGAVSETFRWLRDALIDHAKPFFWYSAHDSNLVAILSVICTKEQLELLGYQVLPPFGSDLQWIVKNDMVKVKLNGHLVRTMMCSNEESCSVANVIGFISQYIRDDLERVCNSI